MSLQAGSVIATSYNTGPYRVEKMDGPCTCSPWGESKAGESEAHYHLELRKVDDRKAGLFGLNGYRLDGTNVWSRDRLSFHGIDHGVTVDLFASEPEPAAAAPATEQFSLF
jgi:hypothetical protein